MPTVNLEPDVFATVLQIKLDLARKEQKNVSMSEAVRMLITFCPTVDKAKLPLKRLY